MLNVNYVSNIHIHTRTKPVSLMNKIKNKLIIKNTKIIKAL